MWGTAIGIAVVLIGACGGGGSGKKEGAVSTSTTTTALAPPESTVEPTTAIANATTSSSTSGRRTVVTQRTQTAKTPTAASKGTSTTIKLTSRGPTGGITNVTSAPPTQPSADVQPGGTVTFLRPAEVQGFDPIVLAASGTSDGVPASMVFDMLFYSDPKDGQVKPQTAESLTSADGAVWMMKLRPNIKFTDGTAYDAAAVKFNWLRLQDPNNHATRAGIANLMQSIDVLDPLTIRITLKAKNAVFPQAIISIPYVASPTAIQAEGSNFMSSPVGAGAFILKDWTRGSRMALSRNPNYWNTPLPFVDQVVIKVIADESQRVNSLKTGEGNLLFTFLTATAATMQNSKIVLSSQILNGGVNFYFNTRKPPFNDFRARQAIALTYNPVEYSKVVTGGLLDPLDSIFRHDSPFYDPSVVQTAYDPTKAQALFDALAKDHGGPLQFTISTFNTANYMAAAQYFQSIWNKYNNVKVDIDPAASPTELALVQAGNFTLSEYGNPFDDPEPGWTGNFTCAASPSISGWCDPTFDSYVQKNRETLVPSERIAAIREAQKIMYAQVPSLYFERRATWIASDPSVQAVQWVDDGLPLFDRMWIKTR